MKLPNDGEIQGSNMYNVGWYARAGHIDHFPSIAKNLNIDGVTVSSRYICNTQLEADHLIDAYGFQKAPFVLAESLKTKLAAIENVWDRISSIEQEYDAYPVVRSLWGSMFQERMSEETMACLFVAHIEAWESFLKDHDINILVCEVPSIMSTCAAWLVCKKWNIDFISFINLPMEKRIAFTSSWCAYCDELEEKIRSIHKVERSMFFEEASAYISRMRIHPTKTVEVQEQINLEKKGKVKRGPINSLDVVWRFREYLKRYRKRRQYYLYRSFSSQLMTQLKFKLNHRLYRPANVFEKAPQAGRERYFLFPLHMFGEWSNHTWMGLGYSDQTLAVRDVALCMPMGCKLYVKEHTANYGEKPLSFYKKIKSMRGVRLIDPYEDTYELIKHSEGIVTLGSTVGFEAFLMKKPVIVIGEPWYKDFPGVHSARIPEALADLLQNATGLRVGEDEEILRIICAMYEVSFDGVRYPHPDTMSYENIQNFSKAFGMKIRSNILQRKLCV